MKPQIVGNQIVHILDYKVVCYHMKYKTRQTIPIENPKCCYINKNMIYGYYNFKMTIMSDSMIRNITTSHHFLKIYSCELIDDVLIIFGKTNNKNETKTIIKNLKNGTEMQNVINNVFMFDISPDKTKVLFYEKKWYLWISDFSVTTFNDFITSDKGEILLWFESNYVCRWKDDKHIIVWEKNTIWDLTILWCGLPRSKTWTWTIFI